MAGRSALDERRALAPSVYHDTDLMHRICGGDTSALDELVRLYWSPVVRYSMGIVRCPDAAEDIAQQVFIQLWKQRSSWEATGTVQAYLYRVARNLSLNERRRGLIRFRWLEWMVRQPQRGEPRPDQLLEKQELEAQIDAAIAALPQRRREAFILARFHDLTYREIAEVMEVSPQTVANQISAALATLRRALARSKLLD